MGQDFQSQFRQLFIHLKVHKALRHLTQTHPHKAHIPFTPNSEFGDMGKWDFSRVKVRLIMSVPGGYEGYDRMDGFGLCRLGKVLGEEGWVASKGERAAAEYQVCLTSPAGKSQGVSHMLILFGLGLFIGTI